MTSLTHEDAQAIQDYEHLKIILRNTRDVYGQIAARQKQLSELHETLARLEKQGMLILERMQQRDSCAPRAKHMAREAVLAGWGDLDNMKMRNDPAFKKLVPETSFLFRASAYLDGIQQPAADITIPTISTFSATSSIPFSSTGQSNRLPFPSSSNSNGEAAGSSQPSARSGESMRQRASSFVTVFGRRVRRLISSPTAPSPTPSEVTKEKEVLNRVKGVRDHLWLTRRYQGGRLTSQATQATPLLTRYTFAWPTSDDPVEFIPLLERALGIHVPGCSSQIYREIIHSDDRMAGHFRSPSSYCDACQAGVLVEHKITEYLRLAPQGGGHLLSIYDQWNGSSHQVQVLAQDRDFVERGVRFVKRCIKSILQGDGIVDPSNKVSPLPPAINRRNIHRGHQGPSRI